MKDCKD
jgi:hypothetical protein